MKLEQAIKLQKYKRYLDNPNIQDSAKEKIRNEYDRYMQEILSDSGEILYLEYEMSSDTVDIHKDISYTNDSVPLHSHTFFEIVFCQSGYIQYLLGNTRYQIKPHDIIIVAPGCSHRPFLFDQNSNDPYERTVLWVDPNFFDQCKHLFRKTEQLEHAGSLLPSNVIRTSGRRFSQIEFFFSQMLREKNHHNPGSNFICTGLFIQLMGLLYRSINEQNIVSISPEHRALLDEIIHYVDTNFANPISLDTVANEFHISPSYVNKILSSQMGVSFYRFVTQRRLTESKNCILSGIPMKEIPYCCGFSDYSVFYKAFKKEFGISPKQFQNQ